MKPGGIASLVIEVGSANIGSERLGENSKGKNTKKKKKKKKKKKEEKIRIFTSIYTFFAFSFASMFITSGKNYPS